MNTKILEDWFEDELQAELRELLLEIFKNGATLKVAQPLINRGQFTLEEVEELQLKAGVILAKAPGKIVLPPLNPNRKPTRINTRRTDAIQRAKDREVIQWLRNRY